MIFQTLPQNELQRIAALARMRLFDTAPEERFDRLARLARQCCGTPIALVSLVSADRQWAKARCGLEIAEMPRHLSFCGYAILQDGLFTVNDAALDPRFSNIPLVVDSPGVRFYAGHPLRTPDGSVIGTLCVMDTQPRQLSPEQEQALRDLAVLAENELAQVSGAQDPTASEPADGAHGARTTFIANVSHELRTPMNGILGMAELLARTELLPIQQDYLASIRECGETLLQMLNDVLDFSKIESGKLVLERVPFDLYRLLDTTGELLALAAEKKGVAVVQTVAPNLPTTVIGDPNRCRQILTNLIGNAIKFTEKGSVTIRASRPKGAPHSDIVRFEVKDTGIGISPEARQRLFQPFVQADSSTSRRFGGTGLGLSICRQLVSLMGGDMGVESSPGNGSLFWFEVPLPEAPAASVSSEEPALPPQTKGVHHGVAKKENRHLHVLLADDNLLNQKVGSGMLGLLGHTADVVASGKEAIEAIQTHPYDLVLMDCQMPGMDGYTAARAIQEIKKERLDLATLPIIAVTANVISGTIDKCRENGMDGYLSKPFTIEQLQATLTKFAGAGDGC